MSRWYRAYEGTVTDAKLGEAALVAEVSRSVAIAAWHCILESAACKNNCGSFETTPRRVAVILCEPPAKIESLFDAFRELLLITDDGVTAWKRRQYESDSSTERSRKSREARRNGGATLQQQDATPPETETETEVSEANASSECAPEIFEERKAAIASCLRRAFPPPTGVSDEQWTAFCKQRRKKLNEHSYTLLVNKLTKIAASGHDPSKLIDTAIERGWETVFEPKEFGKDGKPTQAKLTDPFKIAANKRSIAELYDRQGRRDEAQQLRREAAQLEQARAA